MPGAQFGFLGISYVTFRSLDVIFGIRDRLIVSLPADQFLAFLFFFPTISSGPIDRYRRFSQDWNRPRPAAEFWKDLDGAVHRVFTGFLYKFILAATIKTYWIDRLAEGGFLNTLSYMYGYSLYLYFDFAGYSAFAVGVSYLLGIHTPENFNRPFLAGNIKDFWNRWHISLSTWLRDHVYMRFMLAAAKGHWFTGKYTASYLGYFLTFGLMGLWHGIEPYYLLYGLYHGTLLVGHDLFTRWNKPRQVWRNGPLWRATGTVVTFHMVCLGFLLFSGRIGPTWKPANSVPPVTQGAALAHVGPHESSDGQTIRGWARDASRPDLPVKVAILDGNRLLAGVLADGFRADIQQAGRGNGRRGFSYSIPAELKDGGKHLILVQLAGTDIDLQNMPRSITLSPAFSGRN